MKAVKDGGNPIPTLPREWEGRIYRIKEGGYDSITPQSYLVNSDIGCLKCTKYWIESKDVTLNDTLLYSIKKYAAQLLFVIGK